MEQCLMHIPPFHCIECWVICCYWKFYVTPLFPIHLMFYLYCNRTNFRIRISLQYIRLTNHAFPTFMYLNPYWKWILSLFGCLVQINEKTLWTLVGRDFLPNVMIVHSKSIKRTRNNHISTLQFFKKKKINANFAQKNLSAQCSEQRECSMLSEFYKKITIFWFLCWTYHIKIHQK